MDANTAGIQALLRCWLRETGEPVPPAGSRLRMSLPATGTTLVTEVAYRSAAGWHRFGPVTFDGGAPVDATVLAGLLATEASAARDDVPSEPGGVADLVSRVADSVSRTARYLAAQAGPSGAAITAGKGPASRGFLAAEQAAVYGHPLHPTPKSRDWLPPNEDAHYAPELHGSFPLHWFAVDERLVRHGGPDAIGQVAALAGGNAPEGTVLVPAHPWQARELQERRGVRRLAEGGALQYLGPAGGRWHPTSSVRTVFQPGAPMLKLSLALRITNSRREHHRAELVRGAEMAALQRAGLDALIHAEHPGFRLLGDPAWLAVDLPGETRASALSVSIRDNLFGADDRTVCVAGLVAEQADGRSLLDRVVESDAVEWFARYVKTVVAPVLWLHRTHGLGLEAHQQNTLVTLDERGWPVQGWYRDNQGYYLSPTRSDRLRALVDNLGEDSEAENPDEVIDERITYYVIVNNLLGMVGAMGSQGLADERDLLRAAVELLPELAEPATLPAKANLLTRLDGLDELDGPVAGQSVYVDLPNPFRGA